MKKDTPTQTFFHEIFKNTFIQKYLLTTTSDFPNPAYSLFFVWQIQSASISTEYKLSIF